MNGLGPLNETVRGNMTAVSQYLNGLTPEALGDELHKCCAAESWVQGMLRHAPFASDSELEAIADRIWRDLDESQWLEAFAARSPASVT